MSVAHDISPPTLADLGLARMQKNKGGQPAENRSEQATGSPTLGDLGITKDQSSDWQALARVDDQTFSEIVQEAKDEGPAPLE